jgi:hypothetical protein
LDTDRDADGTFRDVVICAKTPTEVDVQPRSLEVDNSPTRPPVRRGLDDLCPGLVAAVLCLSKVGCLERREATGRGCVVDVCAGRRRRQPVVPLGLCAGLLLEQVSGRRERRVVNGCDEVGLGGQEVIGNEMGVVLDDVDADALAELHATDANQDGPAGVLAHSLDLLNRLALPVVIDAHGLALPLSRVVPSTGPRDGDLDCRQVV